MVGFLIMGGASSIQGILNDKYFRKYSDKVKNGIIVFIATTTIGMSYFLMILTPPKATAKRCQIHLQF